MLRNLNENDFDEYYRLRLKALEENPLAFSSMAEFFRECPKEKHLELLRDSGSDSQFYLKGAFKDEKLVGLIGMKPESRACVDHKATLWGFYVDPAFQNIGIGEKLLSSFLMDALKDKKLSSIRLIAAENCSAALKLFKKAGFKKYGVEPKGIKHEGSFFDQVYMQRGCLT